MKKYMLLIAASLVASALVTGCGSPAEGNTETTPATTGAPASAKQTGETAPTPTPATESGSATATNTPADANAPATTPAPEDKK